MLNRFRRLAAGVRTELDAYRRMSRHPGTPRAAKALLLLAVGYVCLPFDLIPDCIPIIGHVDDLIVVPLLLVLALRLVPPGVVAECRAQARGPRPDGGPRQGGGT